jgi:hypothetical protein
MQSVGEFLSSISYVMGSWNGATILVEASSTSRAAFITAHLSQHGRTEEPDHWRHLVQKPGTEIESKHRLRAALGTEMKQLVVLIPPVVRNNYSCSSCHFTGCSTDEAKQLSSTYSQPLSFCCHSIFDQEFAGSGIVE